MDWLELISVLRLHMESKLRYIGAYAKLASGQSMQTGVEYVGESKDLIICH